VILVEVVADGDNAPTVVVQVVVMIECCCRLTAVVLVDVVDVIVIHWSGKGELSAAEQEEEEQDSKRSHLVVFLSVVPLALESTSDVVCPMTSLVGGAVVK